MIFITFPTDILILDGHRPWNDKITCKYWDNQQYWFYL